MGEMTVKLENSQVSPVKVFTLQLLLQRTAVFAG